MYICKFIKSIQTFKFVMYFLSILIITLFYFYGLLVRPFSNWNSRLNVNLMFPGCLPFTHVITSQDKIITIIVACHSMVHASTVFLSCASVVVRPLTATVCTCCFRHGERNLATGNNILGDDKTLIIII